ncbi:MAG: class I SAM-dependent methyltransferase [Leptolyngbya sp. UWPOB_LEPTO1]|uniref:class I SAM-dependent methyltransferase n=1 Tax=Leptolyngbya sp. UWPOB_LEPTO1 TaxID=2815653 RepID=UPI001AC78C8B|nr:class I SAM-dependent methyltransferase [Leptolyngbya sp. UWPOB_LEPTO1]MBN8560531.1 class I SAM-dependent methyltransferase [Leptolyngbya sp. UWPOB_LEPTO1]
MREPPSTVQAIYDKSAPSWVRHEPTILSDFTARPPTLDFCGNVTGKRVLDLGCGEGYCARQLKERGAASVFGIDISPEMIERAQIQERQSPLGIQYQAGSATDLKALKTESFDLAVAVFLFNYLSIDEMLCVMQEVHRLLIVGGDFIFVVPHPMLAFTHRQSAPFYFDSESQGYFSGRDHAFSGKIWRRDGIALDVRSFHKVFSDYLTALKTAGFTAMPELQELTVTPELLELDSSFFEPVVDIPLHLLMRVTRSS